MYVLDISLVIYMCITYIYLKHVSWPDVTVAI